MWWTENRIILASKSPRRSHLLKEAGIPFEIKPVEVDESFPKGLSVMEVAAYLARKKGRAAGKYIESDRDIILAADSVVVLDGRIYGKPVNRADAVRILQALSGQVHQVITGVYLASAQRETVFSDISSVHFQWLTETEIDYYVDHYHPFDKAGSYAIQDWIGLCKVSRIEGTYSNIMGLPMEKVYRELKKFVRGPING
jgi:septum formation protein